MPLKERSRPIDIPFIGDELVDVFNSQRFLKLFFRQNRQLVNYNLAQELGFQFLRQICRIEYKTILDNAVDVNSTGLDTTAYHRHIILIQRGYLPLIVAHFHQYPPTQRDASWFIKPSSQDLSYLRRESELSLKYAGYGNFPIGLIGLPKSESPLSVLLFQQTSRATKYLKGFDVDMWNCDNQSEVLTALGHWGYKAAVVSFTSSGLLEADGEIVKQFGFTAKLRRVPSVAQPYEVRDALG